MSEKISRINLRDLHEPYDDHWYFIQKLNEITNAVNNLIEEQPKGEKMSSKSLTTPVPGVLEFDGEIVWFTNKDKKRVNVVRYIYELEAEIEYRKDLMRKINEY